MNFNQQYIQRLLTVIAIVLVEFTSVKTYGNHIAVQNNDTTTILSGIVIDTKEEPLPGAVINITSETGITAIAMTGDDGTFTLVCSPGENTIEISILGFEPYVMNLNLLQGKKNDVGVVVLKNNPKELQTVIVKGKRIYARMRPDGYSINVGEIAKSSNNAFDLLGRLPNIITDNGKLEILGKKNVIVKVGNVTLRTDANELPDILRGYEPGIIKSVDIITQPPLRYDPDGNSALIVLNMNSVFDRYAGGMAAVELMKDKGYGGRYGIYGGITFHRDNLFLSIDPSANNNFLHREGYSHYNYQGGGDQDITTHTRRRNFLIGSSITAQYQYNKNGYIGLFGNINRRRFQTTMSTINNYIDFHDIESISHSLTGLINVIPERKLSAYMEHIFRGNNKMWLEASYFSNPNNNLIKIENQQIEIGNVIPNKYYSDNNVAMNGVNLNNDYSFSLDKNGDYLIDFGLKSTFSTQKNNRWERTEVINQPIIDEKRNNAKLHENIIIPYISTTLWFSNSFWLRGGLRSYIVDRQLIATDILEFNKKFVNWIPSLHLSYSPSLSHRFTATLNTTIAHASIENLNPFVIRISESVYQVGNQKLKPQIYYKYNANYTYNGILSIQATVEQSRNLFASIPLADGDNICYTTQNAQNGLIYGLTGSYTYNRIRFVGARIYAYGAKEMYKSNLPQLPNKTNGFQWGIGSNIWFEFNKERTFTGRINGFYQGKRKSAVQITDPKASLSTSLTYALCNRSLQLEMSVIGIIPQRDKGHSQHREYSLYFNNRSNYLTLFFSARYMFHNKTKPGRSAGESALDGRL